MQTPLMSGVFWQQLAKSGLLSPDRIASVAKDLTKRSITTDAEAVRYLVRSALLTRYQADRLLEGRSRGFFFDKYRILDLIGAGGMGWVYRAAHVETGEIVAIKLLLERMKEDKGMLARFQQEARAGLMLNHPNVVRTRASGSAGDTVYMIMDFVEGPSLLEILLQRRRLPWSLACDFARQAALGLHHAHQFGLVHRDVKPQNLLIDRNGHVKVLDFGLAMTRDGEEGDEFSMAMIFGHDCIGTPAFMAPEQAKDGLTADARSDIYGLGCTFYAALVGDTPFPLPTPHEVIKAHQTQKPRSVCEFDPTIPKEVAAVVARMLAKNPDDRFQTGEEVAQALAKWSKTRPIDFNFEKILAERTRNAREKVGELHKSRPSSGSASSTARLTKLSSVAKAKENRSGDSFQPGRESDADARTAGERRKVSIINHQKVVPATDQHLSGTAVPEGKVLTLVGGSSIPLVQNRVVIGRAAECDLQIPDAAVSSRHCEIHFDGLCWWVTDLKSRNGISVNGKLATRRQIADNDTITIANGIRVRLHDASDLNPKEEPPKRKSYAKPLAICLVGLLVVYAIGFAVGMW